MFVLAAALILISPTTQARPPIIAPTPPMGWMSWNLFSDQVDAAKLCEMADALVSSGMNKVGYKYVFIDDGWSAPRDREGKIRPDPIKFPHGIKPVADYLHVRGLKLGIYSDAAPLTCAGYTGSYGHEAQDAKLFAEWGIDYLKYDYCGAPPDRASAEVRYQRMASALRSSGRSIVFSICEWGHRKPWLWASGVGGQLWRCAGDVRDKWRDSDPDRRPPYAGAYGISDIIDDNATLSPYAGPGHWNDMDMLVVGLHGKPGPSSAFNANGCTDNEYRSQMSMWCMMASPLAASNDIRTMDESTKSILMNKEVIDVDQDRLGNQASLKIRTDQWYVFVKPLAGR